MIVAIDVQYDSKNNGFYGLVGFESWTSSVPAFTRTGVKEDCHQYISGQFYKRELPVIQKAMERLDSLPDILVVDGHVDLDEAKPGIGRYLFELYDAAIPIVGVAKNQFGNSEIAIQVTRGKSANPLFVSTAGVKPEQAAKWIREMHGPFRVPKLLKLADRLARAMDTA